MTQLILAHANFDEVCKRPAWQQLCGRWWVFALCEWFGRWCPLAQRLRLFAQPRLQARAVFFDFDRTLTVVHVFKSLAGWADKQVCCCPILSNLVNDESFALTERGQLRRLCQLGPAWIEQAFGGTTRIAVLRQLLAGISAGGFCRIVLVTRGYVGVARKCLHEAGLLEFFERVYGNIGEAYGEGTAFDAASAAVKPDTEQAQLLGGDQDSEWHAKWQIIFRYMEQDGLTGDQVILVDDDPDEIGSVSHAVRTLLVEGNAGLAEADVAELLHFVGVSEEPWAERCRRAWHQVRDPLAIRPPAIVAFNRKHLQVRLSRHLVVLEEEFTACPSALRKVRMLLKQPLLLYSVAQREFLERLHTMTGDSNKTKVAQLVSLGMRSIGFVEDSHWSRGMSEMDTHSHWLRGMSDIDTQEGWTPLAASLPMGRVEETKDPVGTQPTIEHERSLHFYQEPVGCTSTSHQSRLMASVVEMFQRSLMRLCPITMKTVGRRRNVIFCHDAKGVPPEEAVWSRYRKEARLGVGHFGEVFQAVEVCSGRQVAVKEIERMGSDKATATEDEDATTDEVHTLRALAHPNLLRVYEVVQCEEYVYIISELATGGTLSSYLLKQGSGGWIAGAIQQIVSCVAYCHRHHVLHGDLKPENVLVSGQRPDGSPLCIVCDFGHSTVCINSAQVAAPGDPRYIAPEVVLEEGLSPKSDIYSLGVTAFELLTGGWLPFFNDKAVSLQMSYYKLKFGGVREEILSLKGLGWEDLGRLQASPLEAQEVVKQMLSRNAKERPTAVQVQQSAWLQAAHGPCKRAYDTQLKSDVGAGWGLWAPHHPQFAERLRRRATCSWTCRMLLGLLGSGLPPDEVHGARLLFRRLDEGGEGMLSVRHFRAGAERVGVAAEDAAALFAAGDLHEQGHLDFKNVVMLFLDLDYFSEPWLLQAMCSVLNRIRGPHPKESQAARGVRVDINELEAILCQRPDPRMKRVLEDLKAELSKSGTSEYLTPEWLLRVARDDPFSATVFDDIGHHCHGLRL